MRTMNYTTLIFDAFDTVIHINESKLPTHHATENRHNDGSAAYAAYPEFSAKRTLTCSMTLFLKVSNQVSVRRRADLKEVVSQERFRMMLELLRPSKPENYQTRLSKRSRGPHGATAEIV